MTLYLYLPVAHCLDPLPATGKRADAFRDEDPVATVLLLVVGAAAAAWVMAQVGHAVGPPSPGPVLADARIGATAPAEVEVHALAAYLVWPIAVLFGAVAVLWASRGSHPGE